MTSVIERDSKAKEKRFSRNEDYTPLCLQTCREKNKLQLHPLPCVEHILPTVCQGNDSHRNTSHKRTYFTSCICTVVLKRIL